MSIKDDIIVECPCCNKRIYFDLGTAGDEDFFLSCPSCKFAGFFLDEDFDGDKFVDYRVEDIRKHKLVYKEKVVFQSKKPRKGTID